MTIICKFHGSFLQSATSHLNGNGCPKCYKDRRHGFGRLTRDQFIEKSNETHSGLYDYSKSKYITNSTKTTITCKIHGDFTQTPAHHMSGTGCPSCGNLNLDKRHDTKKFIERSRAIHNDVYDYSESVYINAHSKIKIKCNLHGFFSQTPNNHIRGQGCPECGKRKSTLEEIDKMSEYEKNTPYYLYHVKVIRKSDMLTFNKIGVTKHKNILKRFPRCDYDGFVVEVIDVICDSKSKILMKEHDLLDEMYTKNARYKMPQEIRENFRGWSECFYKNEYYPVLKT